MGREQKASDSWADPATLELLPLMALKRQAAAAGLAAHQAAGGERPTRLIAYASMLREIARRTGESETLAKAASAGSSRRTGIATALTGALDPRARTSLVPLSRSSRARVPREGLSGSGLLSSLSRRSRRSPRLRGAKGWRRPLPR